MSATIIDLKGMGDDALLHAVLYHSGTHRSALTPNQHMLAVEKCDGYGRLSIAQILQMEVAWDWSHVRDSSDEAKASAAKYVRSLLK